MQKFAKSTFGGGVQNILNNSTNDIGTGNPIFDSDVKNGPKCQKWYFNENGCGRWSQQDGLNRDIVTGLSMVGHQGRQ